MPSKSIPKDTNAPKKPLTAYMLFSAAERPKLKASGLDNFAEMNKALGAAWKQADTKTKAHYEKEYEREKTRYENELKDYEKSGQPAPSSKAAQKVQPTAKPKTTTTTSSKKNPPAAKNVKPQSDEEEDDDQENEASEEEESSEEEEEEKPAPPPAKNSRKKK